jgi:hypothetical protein
MPKQLCHSTGGWQGHALRGSTRPRGDALLGRQRRHLLHCGEREDANDVARMRDVECPRLAPAADVQSLTVGPSPQRCCQVVGLSTVQAESDEP